MLQLDKTNFEQEVLKAEGVVLVDFWGETCDNCLELMPHVEKLAEQYGEQVKFAKLNIKGNRRLAMSQKVMGLPSIVFYENGEKKEQLGGEGLTAEQIEEAIKTYVK